RHQAQNLRRNGQPKRPAGPRRDARPRQDLQETENFLLRLPRRPPWHSRARNPPARDPRQPRPKLTAARKFAPVTNPNKKFTPRPCPCCQALRKARRLFQRPGEGTTDSDFHKGIVR